MPKLFFKQVYYSIEKTAFYFKFISFLKKEPTGSYFCIASAIKRSSNSE